MSQPQHARCVVVRNPQGLHARPADLLVKRASGFASDIQLEKQGQQADCKSILSILTLGAEQGTELTLSARGADAAEAVEAIAELFDQGFYELEPTEPQ